MKNTQVFSIENLEFSEALYLKNVKDPMHNIKDECEKGNDK